MKRSAGAPARTPSPRLDLPCERGTAGQRHDKPVSRLGGKGRRDLVHRRLEARGGEDGHLLRMRHIRAGRNDSGKREGYGKTAQTGEGKSGKHGGTFRIGDGRGADT